MRSTQRERWTIADGNQYQRHVPGTEQGLSRRLRSEIAITGFSLLLCEPRCSLVFGDCCLNWLPVGGVPPPCTGGALWLSGPAFPSPWTAASCWLCSWPLCDQPEVLVMEETNHASLPYVNPLIKSLISLWETQGNEIKAFVPRI